MPIDKLTMDDLPIPLWICCIGLAKEVVEILMYLHIHLLLPGIR